MVFGIDYSGFLTQVVWRERNLTLREGSGLQGYLAHKKTLPPSDPTVGLCLGSYGGPRGKGVFLWARYPCSVQGFGFGGLVLGFTVTGLEIEF